MFTQNGKKLIFFSIFVLIVSLGLFKGVFVKEAKACGESNSSGTSETIWCPDGSGYLFKWDGVENCECYTGTYTWGEYKETETTDYWPCDDGSTISVTHCVIRTNYRDSSCDVYSADGSSVILEGHCNCVYQNSGPCPGDGDGEEGPSCQISAQLGANREVAFSIYTEGSEFNQYQLDYGDGSKECNPDPCPVNPADSFQGLTFNHTYGSSGAYRADFTLFDGGIEVTSCGDGFDVLLCQGTVAPNSKVNIRNLQCPSKAQIGSDFPISYEFQGTGPDWLNRYEVRMGGYNKGLGCATALVTQWCAYGEDYPEGLWCLDDTKKLTCPDSAGSYTFGVQGIGTSHSDNTQCQYPDEYDDRETCNVQCVANLPTRLLTVTKQGTGQGTATSNPAGINCGTDCTENYNTGTTVNLTATASPGSSFAGWSGDCSGTGSCSVVMNQARNVTATFNSSDLPNQPPGPPVLEPPTSLEGRLTLNPEKKSVLEQLSANLLEIITFGFLKK